MLCDRTDCDMRSCLNTLQFLARRNSRITQRVVEGAAIGIKDTTRGAFALWTDLLQVTRTHIHTLPHKYGLLLGGYLQMAKRQGGV
jgi:hypothetical protein